MMTTASKLFLLPDFIADSILNKYKATSRRAYQQYSKVNQCCSGISTCFNTPCNIKPNVAQKGKDDLFPMKMKRSQKSVSSSKAI